MSEIEKQFFDTFGIKPKYKTCIFKYCPYKKEYDCENCDNREWRYPEITDHILLELIFLQPLSIEFKYPRNIEELKNTLLGYYIEELSLFAEPSEAEIFRQQVRTLFEKG